MSAEIAAKRFDPKRDGVGVRGGFAPLTWHTTRPATDADGDGRYEVAVDFAKEPFGGQPVTYKYKVERAGKPNDGWESGRNRCLTLNNGAQVTDRPFDAPPEPVAASRVGDIRRHAEFKSKFVRARDVQVWLPPGYAEHPRERYPVLYLNDGQNVFDGTAMGMEWQVDETADALIRTQLVTPFIVVAVDSLDETRTDDLTPTPVTRTDDDGTKHTSGGKAQTYARFLLEELKPFVDRNYRTLRDAPHTAIGGASHGGLVSLFLTLEHPDVFGQALVMSPSAGWDDDVLIKRVQALKKRVPVRYWVDVGRLESQRIIEPTRRLVSALEGKGWKRGVDVAVTEQPDASHDELAWASRMPEALRFLFAKR